MYPDDDIKSGRRFHEAGRTGPLAAARPLYLLLAGLLVAYVALRLVPGLRLHRSHLSSFLSVPIGLLAALAALHASRRTPDSPASRRAWLFIAAAIAAQTSG